MGREAPEMTLDHLNQHTEQWWYLSAPSSGGVITLMFCDGRLYTVSDGDMRDRGSCGITEETVEEFASYSSNEGVLQWLRKAGHLPPVTA